MNNLKNKKVIISVFGWSLVCLVFLFFVLFKNNSSKLKGYVGIYGASPVNTYFNDNEFYACVLNAYNMEHQTKYGLDHNLTDEELSSITKLDCYDPYGNSNPGETIENKYKNELISNFDTYIEHLTSLIYLVSDTHLTTIKDLYTYDPDDFTGIEKLSNLSELKLKVKSDAVFDISKNINLKKIIIDTDRNLNLENNVNLEEVVSNGNAQITGLPNLSKIESLTMIGYKSIVDDIATLTSLKKLVFTNSNITDFTSFDSLTNLEEFSVSQSYWYVDEENTKKVSDLKILQNLTSFSWNVPTGYASSIYPAGAWDYLGTLPKMEKLEKLSLKNAGISNVDFSNFPNLKYLNISNAKLFKTDKISDIKGLETLNNLEYLDIRGIGNVKENYQSSTPYNELVGISNLKSLKTLLFNQKSFNEECENVENLFNNYNNTELDFSNFPNLKTYVGVVSSNFKNVSLLSKMENLVLQNEPDLKEFHDIEEFPNLKTFIIGEGRGSTSEILVSKMPNIEYYMASNWQYQGNITSYDLSNNPKLKKIILPFVKPINGLENLKDLEYIFIEGNSNLCNTTYDYDFSNNPNLKGVYIRKFCTPEGQFDKINVENNKNLIYLNAGNSKFSDLNLENNDNLVFMDLGSIGEGFTPSIAGSKYLLPIKPSKQIPLKELSYETKNVKLVDNYLVPTDFGEGSISFYFDYSNSLIQKEHVYANQFVGFIFDSSKITFKKYDYDMYLDYLFTGTDKTSKKIINNIRQIGNKFYVTIDNNILKLIEFKSDKDELKIKPNIVKEIKLINLSSSDYEISDDDIYYYGNFDLDKINISNAEGVVEDNKLNIIYNEKNIKSYNLVDKGGLLGDVNGDGKISISDIVSQYKHVKYIIDLDEESKFRADINSDDDVSISDVSGLYKTIKENN